MMGRFEEDFQSMGLFFFLLGPKLQIWGLGLKSSMDESKRVL